MKNDPHSYTASMLREFYVREQERRRRRPYKFHSRYQGLGPWRKAATLCLELGADPQDFITAAFAYCTLKTGPTPALLAGKAMRGWYNSWNITRGREKARVVHAKTGEFVEVDRVTINDIDQGMQSFMNILRTVEIDNPVGKEAEDLMSSSLTEMIPPLVKVLLFPNSATILAKYGEEAYHRLRCKPDAEAVEAAGFDVDATLRSLVKAAA